MFISQSFPTRIVKQVTRLRMLHYRYNMLPISFQWLIYQSCHKSPLFSKIPRQRAFSSTAPLYLKGANPHTSHRRSPRRLLLLAPLAGLAIVYLSPRPKSLIHSFFSCPTLIPCSPDPPSSSPKALYIQSPYERRPSLWSKIKQILRSHVLEPLWTTQRFLYLCFLFVPVLISAPMLLIGAPGSGTSKRKRAGTISDRQLKRRRLKSNEGEGERWGAVWWYDFMVQQMQRAGPTFIKVFHLWTGFCDNV